ncbi:MAG: IS1182 family transposase [Dehalococcoidia bacterium]
MPLRPFSRDQAWLLPPTLDDFLDSAHPARFVAAFLDGLDPATRWALEGEPLGDPMGAPAYDPHALLGIWVYGFMTGVRSPRKLEAACRDQIPYLWLSGNQRPDHNTLWRYYHAHRQEMRVLLKRTVKVAVRAGLVDLALQAVDGTKVAASAGRDCTLDSQGLERLLERTEQAIRELEAENATGGDAPPPQLPKELEEQQALREQVKAAMAQVQAEEGPGWINLTDPDAGLLRAPHGKGFITGYNAQAMVSPLILGEGQGMLVTAVEVVAEGDDHPQLQPLMAQAWEQTGGQEGVTTLADAGYYSAANLQACAQRGQQVLMAAPEDQKRAKNPYHKDHFLYCQETNTYQCPQGQALTFMGTTRHRDGYLVQAYRAKGGVCRKCPAFGQCTKDRSGRQLRVGEYQAVHQRHRELMQRPETKALYRRRKALVEPVFGIIKEQQNGRRFLLRRLDNVRAEWSLLAVGLNLRSLYRAWRTRLLGGLERLPAAA